MARWPFRGRKVKGRKVKGQCH